jgi:cobalt/nickel transport protein
VKGRKLTWAIGLGVAVAVAALLSPWASSWPDGLEHVSERLGLTVRDSSVAAARAPFSDYSVPGLARGPGTSAAGILGTLLVFGIGCAAGWVLRRRQP